MTDTHEDHEREARELLASRIQDFHYYLELAQNGFDVYDLEEPEGDEADGWPGNLGDYGLEWAKDTTNHRDQTVTYVHVLSTGGPHDEFQVTFDPETGQVQDVVYIYLPWWDRVEIDCTNSYDIAPDHPETAGGGTVLDFYATFFGDLIQDDTVNERKEWSR